VKARFRENAWLAVAPSYGGDDRWRLAQAAGMAEAAGLRLMATNDVLYHAAEQRPLQDVLTAIRLNTPVAEAGFALEVNAERHMKPREEMARLFRQYPEALAETLRFAESLSFSLGELQHNYPDEPTESGLPAQAELERLTWEGAKERFPGGIPEGQKSLIRKELALVERKNYARYFLTVHDIMSFARSKGILCQGRGSAANSLICYCLRITDLDPLRYGLIFERFLNPERKLMPDIDMDFDERRRDEIIRYVAERYGAGSDDPYVAQIVTFQTIKGKQGIRDAARVLGFPASVGDRLCKMYPPALLGREYPIEKALEISQELREAYEKEEDSKEVIDTARALEGLRREDSVHAAGVVIGDAPLVNYLPLKLSKDSRDDSRRVVTQFDMHGAEKLGLLKMDFLGLRNLSVIEDTVRILREQGVGVDVDHLDVDDEATYDMLRSGETTGVFQLESPGMRTLIRDLAPDLVPPPDIAGCCDPMMGNCNGAPR
jgi:error-prone DNA polymerase